MIPSISVTLDITFSGPLSLTFWNKLRSFVPVKAPRPSDFPDCNSDIRINSTETIINKILNIKDSS